VRASAEAVLEAALQLPRPELEQVLERLLSALDAAEDTGVDAAWSAEAERRLGELRRGEVKPIPWAEVRAAACDHAKR